MPHCKYSKQFVNVKCSGGVRQDLLAPHSPGIPALRRGIVPGLGPSARARMTAQGAVMGCKNKGLQRAVHHPIPP